VPAPSSTLPTPEAEASHLLRQQGGPAHIADCTRLISTQFVVMQTRSHLLLTLATIILTITGFSGPRIASSGVFARTSMAIGLVLVLSAVVILLRAMRIRWLTQFIDDDPQALLVAIISYRNNKTRLYLVYLVLITIGLSCYVMAVIAYLITGDPIDRLRAAV
jgi:hypothetical protein